MSLVLETTGTVDPDLYRLMTGGMCSAVYINGPHTVVCEVAHMLNEHELHMARLTDDMTVEWAEQRREAAW